MPSTYNYNLIFISHPSLDQFGKGDIGEFFNDSYYQDKKTLTSIKKGTELLYLNIEWIVTELSIGYEGASPTISISLRQK